MLKSRGANRAPGDPAAHDLGAVKAMAGPGRLRGRSRRILRSERESPIDTRTPLANTPPGVGKLPAVQMRGYVPYPPVRRRRGSGSIPPGARCGRARSFFHTPHSALRQTAGNVGPKWGHSRVPTSLSLHSMHFLQSGKRKARQQLGHCQPVTAGPLSPLEGRCSIP